MATPHPVIILMADDDADDRLLAGDALKKSSLATELRSVEDGEQLLDYLKGRGAYAQPGSAPRPGLILLDLNMPRMDGREALKAIKADPQLSNIPIVVFSTSKAQEDIDRTYDLGVNSFITKPISFRDLIVTMQALSTYWFEVVKLPPDHS